MFIGKQCFLSKHQSSWFLLELLVLGFGCRFKAKVILTMPIEEWDYFNT
jgi:hypothetical protein